ncbi:beta strand repeat-containing protein [Dolichospermum flos-aquae]|uniref:Proprotein convertase P-domain-containing protein n=1 Tax=Dolichospermum flos-aquae LEGE 04289 TaxID=1828708 RepID=A0ACC5Q6Q6_DOLFA|nr:proprotein convertase P-domain-containing protein [Dolichospermum flos-aquae]MBE9221045.1 proprotein convertase P-domain-containing protein [Dolichospermum flos-aquae LEGE 04289]
MAIISFFKNLGNISIPNYGTSDPYPSIIAVSGISGNLTKLTVTLANLNHTWPGDIDVLLVSPTGANSILMSDAGDSDDINNVTLTFDATATSSLPDSAISSGTYRPTNYYDGDFFDSPAPEEPYNADFSVFNGTNLNGEWRLYIVDDFGGDSGNVAGGWSISIATDPGDDSNNNLQGTIVDDIITGLGGDDTLVGGAGNDTLDGGAGNDTLDGGAGVDSLVGGAGDDVYIVDSAADIITENANDGVDTIKTSATYILGDALNVENLTLLDGAINGTGNAANNVITGNSAANILIGSAGVDTLVGGAGDDVYIVDNTYEIITENANDGVDTIKTSVTYILRDALNVENLTLLDGAINGTGNAANNVITGNSAANILIGGAGNDTLIGGAGNDTYYVDNTADIITEVDNGGNDSVLTDANYALSESVENLTLQGTATINGTGNAANNIIRGNSAANTLTGNAGNDTLNGGEGADTLNGGEGADTLNGGTGIDSLIGGAGNDIYYVDNTADIITEVDNGGNDSVLTDANYALSNSVENLTLQGTATINGTGNAANNIIRGNSAANTLTGNAGNDTLNGGEGADTLNGGEGADTLNGGTGIDSLIGGAGNDIYYVDNTADIITEVDNGGNDSVLTDANYALSNSVENLTLQGTATINGTGNAANNIIRGNSAANTLTGNAGNDTLNGGAGNDILTGGVGKDTLTGGLGVDRFDYRTLADSVFSNFDVITDFNATTGNDLLVVSTVTSFYDAGAVARFSTSEIAKNLPATVFTANSAAQFTLGTGANIRTFVAINDATAGFNAILSNLEIT